MCLAQGHKVVRLEPGAPRSRVKHATTEPLRSLIIKNGSSHENLVLISYAQKPLLILYLIEMPFNTFANRADPRSGSSCKGLQEHGGSTLFA